MQKKLLNSILILALGMLIMGNTGCDKKTDCCTIIDTDVQILYRNELGKNLINSTTDFEESNIKVYYKDGNKFEYIYEGNLDSPNMHRIHEDENGNLNDWWTAEDRQKFEAKTQLIVEQFNSYVAVDSLTVNGRLTLGENIADLGGIVMGYEAFKKTQQYKKGEKIAGLTPDQRFFLGYANAWMINTRPEALSDQVRSDEHSPAKFRVLGPLSNMPEFYKTFNVADNNKMYRSDSLRVIIW
jgi:hypothetical protein